jgi:hypothetical protein
MHKQLIVASVLVGAAWGCGGDRLPTNDVARALSFSVARTPQQFTVGPLDLGGIDIRTPGGNLHFRDTQLNGPVSGDLAGQASIVLNAELDGTGSGPTQGTITITGGDAVWQGTLTGHFVGALPDGIQLFSQVDLHGPSQSLIRAKCEETTVTSETLSCSGEVADPGQ